MRTRLWGEIEFHRIREKFSLSDAETFALLYRIAEWFQQYSKYGALRYDYKVIDQVVQVPGIADALREVGWLYTEGGATTLRGFCAASKIRKSITGKLRAMVFEAGRCAACGATDKLQIDHDVPISRGGPSTPDNLQLLCMPCNRKKGTKTMEEFLRDR